MQYLANSLTAIISRRNYVCGAKAWIDERGGNSSTLSSREAKAVLKGAAALSPSLLHPAPGLLPHDLVNICTFLDKVNNGLVIKAAITIGFFGFLRSSNLLCPDATLWGGPHTLTRSHILAHPTGLAVVLTSTKTLRLHSTPTVLALPRIEHSPACPTAAWEAYTLLHPAHPTSTAFTLADGSALVPAHVVHAMRTALVCTGCPYAHNISMHSLRRGGTWAAVHSGANTDDIATHGTWASKGGMRTYLPSQPSSRVANKLATLFAPTR